MDKAFIFFPSLVEGDAWVRADLIAGIWRGAGVTVVHLTNGQAVTTDLHPGQVLHNLQVIHRVVEDE